MTIDNNPTIDIRDAVATAHKHHHRQLYFCAYGILKDSEAARDCVADAYCKALARDQFEGGSSLYTYLYKVTKNNALDAVRSHRVKMRSNAAPADVESRWVPADIVPRPYPGPLQALLTKERAELARRTLGKMSEVKRDALLLHCVDGWKYKDIAECEGVAIGTVMSRINHARAALNAAEAK